MISLQARKLPAVGDGNTAVGRRGRVVRTFKRFVESVRRQLQQSGHAPQPAGARARDDAGRFSKIFMHD